MKYKSMDILVDKIKTVCTQYKIELFTLTGSCVILVASLIVIYITHKNIVKSPELKELPDEYDKSIQKKVITIDIEGEIKKPDVYSASLGARLKDIIMLAGGFTDSADKNLIKRQFNLAKKVTDGEKIYIPSILDANNNSESMAYIDVNTQNTDTNKIDLNHATSEELDTLPSLGTVTVKKVIENRPYSTIEDLLIKKVIKKSVFEKIKDMITI